MLSRASATASRRPKIFRQWIFQNQVPTYRWQYQIATVPQTAPTPSPGMPVARALMPGLEAPGAKVLRVNVKQEEVPEDFRMPVPIRVEFDDSSQATVQVWVAGAGAEIDIPLPAGTLRRIVFNVGGAVLCRLKNENGERMTIIK